MIKQSIAVSLLLGLTTLDEVNGVQIGSHSHKHRHHKKHHLPSQSDADLDAQIAKANEDSMSLQKSLKTINPP